MTHSASGLVYDAHIWNLNWASSWFRDN